MTIKDVSYFTRQGHSAGNESGRSLIEMLGTIGIITMITVGAISGAGTGMTMWKANQTHEQIMEIIQGITDLYSWNRYGWPDKAFDLNELCANANFSSCDEDDGTIQLSLGTLDKIVGSNNGTTLTITVSNIPYRAYQHLQGKKDKHVITSIECSGSNCSGDSHGDKTLIFTHNSQGAE